MTEAMARGPIAQELDGLWWALFWTGGAVYVLFLVLLAASAVRRRRGDAELRAEVPSRTANRWIVLGGVVLPGLVLPATLGLSVATMRDLPQHGPPDGLVVEVVGYQWWWSIRYPDHGVTVANELHIPVGRPVELRLTSADVIHSFWVPELAGKIDALPDDVNTLVIEADEPGEYRGTCAEFCGLQHARMLVLVVAEPADRFDAWLDGQRQPASAPATATAAEGARLFTSKGCARCHTVRGTTASGDDGPDLTHFASRRTVTAALLGHTPENLARWVRDPDSVKEGTEMPVPRLTEAELDTLLAYLESLE